MIPIYRGLKLGTENEYVEGQYLAYKGYPTIFNEYGLDGIEIDKSTLSIHFPDMLDSNGNKIFASLQEDGKGGDVILFCEVENITGTAIYEKSSIFITGGCSEYLSEILQREDEDFKIIGIQQ